MAGAQEMPPQNSERLRKKIESVNLIYRRTLLRQYEEYITSLKQDIESVRKSRAEVGDASAAARELDAGIERLTAELKEAEEKAAAFRAELGKEGAQAMPQQAAIPQTAVPAASVCDRIYALSNDTQSADDSRDDALPNGVIWCGEVGVNTGTNPDDPRLTVQTLAERAAPILWFSPDEPLRQDGGEKKNIPEPLPGDKAAKAPVVYFRVSRIIDGKMKDEDKWSHKINECTPEIESATKGNSGFNICTKELSLKSLDEVTVRYYFYYRADIGFESHRNDLESLRLDIGFTPLDEHGKKPKEGVAVRYYVAHIKTAVGAAHGVSWFDNELAIGDHERDVSLPLTVLIEEGKHATSPDRNADGIYTPGYDVNRRYNDAWGIRDVIGSGQLGGAHYQSSMTKQRRRDGMIVPLVREGGREVDRAELLERYRGTYRDDLMSRSVAPDYMLKRITPKLTGVVEQEEQNAKDKGLSIVGLMRREHFEREEPRKTTGHGFFEQAAKVARTGVGIERGNKGDVLDALTFGYRYDGQHGFTISPPTGRRFLSFLGGYVLPKLNFMPTGSERRWSIEGLYTPSASRTFDWYLSAGPEWFRPSGEDGYDTRFAAEGGLRFRFRKWQYFGGRLGVRTTGFPQPRGPRFVIEFGPGAF